MHGSDSTVVLVVIWQKRCPLPDPPDLDVSTVGPDRPRPTSYTADVLHHCEYRDPEIPSMQFIV